MSVEESKPDARHPMAGPSITDRFLLASWIYLYGALLLVFGLLKRTETESGSGDAKST
jgi:hypothetical protein